MEWSCLLLLYLNALHRKEGEATSSHWSDLQWEISMSWYFWLLLKKLYFIIDMKAKLQIYGIFRRGTIKFNFAAWPHIICFLQQYFRTSAVPIHNYLPITVDVRIRTSTVIPYKHWCKRIRPDTCGLIAAVFQEIISDEIWSSVIFSFFCHSELSPSSI